MSNRTENSATGPGVEPKVNAGKLPTVTRVEPGSNNHWLTLPSTIRRLWWMVGVVLCATLVLQAFIPVKGKMHLDGTFGFGAWYGFGACVLMVLVSRVLGWLLKRPDTYYAEDESTAGGRGDHDA